MSKVRGSIMLVIVKNLRHFGIWDTVPVELREELGDRISVTRWYDTEAFIALAKLLGEYLENRPDEAPAMKPNQTVWEFMGAHWIHSFLDSSPFDITKKSPERALGSFYSFWKLRHDTGTPTVHLGEPGQAEIEIKDHDLILPQFCEIVRGAIRELVECAGAKNVVVMEPRCRSRADESCCWQVSWQVA